MRMHIGIVTLFPEMFRALTDYGISGRAVKSGLVEMQYWNPRDFALDKHRTVDDKPFGGGPGMLMKTEPLMAAIQAARVGMSADTGQQASPHVVYLSPQGAPMNQAKVLDLAARKQLIVLCGRYQGIDARVLEAEVDEEISLGDFIISGGELAAMALIDAIIRFQPGALGDEDSAQLDSFANGLLHSPQYTRPQEFDGRQVPEILLSGDHAAIDRWRLQQSLGMTRLKRPELLEKLQLTTEQQALLQQFIDDFENRN